MGGYLFQNLISYIEEIATYIKGGWVSNTDVIILYIHNSILNLAFTTEIVKILLFVEPYPRLHGIRTQNENVVLMLSDFEVICI